MLVLGRSLASLVTIIALTVVLARAQEDLGEHKTGAQLFAADCVTCHHSPRGLAKNKFSLVLWSFLRDHYTSSNASAQKLTAYLESMNAPRATPQHGTRISSDTAGSARPPRPPAPVPTH
jgi:hypothetical protein